MQSQGKKHGNEHVSHFATITFLHCETSLKATE